MAAAGDPNSYQSRYGKIANIGGMPFGRMAFAAVPEVQGFEMTDVEALRLEGAHLCLRPLVAADFESYAALVRANGSHLAPTGSGPTGDDDPTASPEAFAAFVDDRELQRALDEAHRFVVETDGELAGEFALAGILRGHVQAALVEGWIGQAYAGQHFAPEAYVLLARHAFEDLDLHRLDGAVLPDNAGVKAALAKLGIRSEGISPNYMRVNGEWRDHERYVLTAEEWAERGADLVRDWLR